MVYLTLYVNSNACFKGEFMERAIPAIVESGEPFLPLRGMAARTGGLETLRSNIMVAKVIAEVMKTTLGPRGMDKLLIDNIGASRITSDGATILDYMYVEHPVARILVNFAKSQDENVGDGTKTTVILAGELLSKSEKLIDQRIHPVRIIRGYRKAAEKAVQILNDMAIEVDVHDVDVLKNVAMTAMRVKSAVNEHLADIAVRAVKHVTKKQGDTYIVDKKKIQVLKKKGQGLPESELIQGIMLEKEIAHPNMPRKVENAKIALLDCWLKFSQKQSFRRELKIQLTSPQQVKGFMDMLIETSREIANKIVASGANVVFCSKVVDEYVKYFLAKAKVLAADRLVKNDFELLAKATGGRIVSDLDDLTSDKLGRAASVKGRKIHDSEVVFVEGCSKLESISVLIRGGADYIISEAERAFHDAVSVVADAIKDKKVIAGGGAAEIEVARKIRNYARGVAGKEQLAIEAFAEAVEVIPKTLAQNAGLSPIDILVELRAAHEKPTNLWFGINAFDGKLKDAMKFNIIEPLSVKVSSIRSATEAAEIVLRIDDIIVSGKTKEAGKP